MKDERAVQLAAWRALNSAQRKKLIKERQAFPRFGWPAIYPPEKDPLAPRPAGAQAAAAAG